MPIWTSEFLYFLVLVFNAPLNKEPDSCVPMNISLGVETHVGTQDDHLDSSVLVNTSLGVENHVGTQNDDHLDFVEGAHFTFNVSGIIFLWFAFML